ncbi:hypothetical protein [Streptomyces mirabilis]|uniref:hypothetical protein n=1 Tax=Streptomyces mirabilis TaxID=68239 RepID=UPI00296E7967|nr:hypothetical protein [Streptomyces mirabilis]
MEGRGAATLAEHLAQREHNPNGLDQEQFASRVQRRQAILETTSTLTTLSERGGPFFV